VTSASGLLLSPVNHFCASDYDFHLSTYAIHKATYIRNKKFIADLSQIFESTKELMDETMFTKFSDHNFPGLLPVNTID
jgi:hypothetical protein